MRNDQADVNPLPGFMTSLIITLVELQSVINRKKAPREEMTYRSS